jgi:hypothetical protein
MVDTEASTLSVGVVASSVFSARLLRTVRLEVSIFSPALFALFVITPVGLS